MHGVFTVEITPEFIAMESTAEFVRVNGIYTNLERTRHLIVLVLLSRVF